MLSNTQFARMMHVAVNSNVDLVCGGRPLAHGHFVCIIFVRAYRSQDEINEIFLVEAARFRAASRFVLPCLHGPRLATTIKGDKQEYAEVSTHDFR